MTLDELKPALAGDWASLAVELRPSASKNADGSAKPFFLKREFTYHADDRFALTIQTFADPGGAVPLARIGLQGHMHWRGPHAVAPGAQKVDFVADDAYTLTPLLPAFADGLNQAPLPGDARWAAGVAQSLLGKAFAPFGLVASQPFSEHDLVYLHGDLLFWGARHVDGRGFDSEQNRPTSLQIPLVRRQP